MASSKHHIDNIMKTVILITIISSPIFAQINNEKLGVQNPCVSKTTCRECIQTRSCAWCLQPDFGDKPRCFQPSLVSFSGGCSEEYTWNPDNEQLLILHESLTRKGSGGVKGSMSAEGSYSGQAHGHAAGSAHASGSASGAAWGAGKSESIVQISPQRVGLKLRISN